MVCLLHEKARKGTTKNANTQFFLEKNAFLHKKSADLLHLTNVASGECWKIRSNIVRKVCANMQKNRDPANF